MAFSRSGDRRAHQPMGGVRAAPLSNACAPRAVDSASSIAIVMRSMARQRATPLLEQRQSLRRLRSTAKYGSGSNLDGTLHNWYYELVFFQFLRLTLIVLESNLTAASFSDCQ